MAKVLYISYTGLMEPLGQSQVWQYLRKLSEKHNIFLITYEKKQNWQDVLAWEDLIRKVRMAGICWIPLRYHKYPTLAATVYDLIKGFGICIYLSLRYRIRIIHARSYVPSVLALILKKILGICFIFDMRGFWADERIDAGLLKNNSFSYKLAKFFEKRFLLDADIIVSLTHAGEEVIRKFTYLKDDKPLSIELIPTCVNLEIFYPQLTFRDKEDDFVLGYVGTTGGWYLFDPVLESFNALRSIKRARMLIINQGESSYIQERLKANNIPLDLVEIKTVPYLMMPKEIWRMDAGIFFIKPVFSKLASSPTKFGEFLACGVPVLCNSGVGDLAQILESNNIGVVLSNFGTKEIEAAVKQLLVLVQDSDTKNRCIGVAIKQFSLEQGVNSYSRIYNELSKKA